MTKKLKINLGNGPVEVIDGGYVDLDDVDYRRSDGTRITNELAQQWADEYERRALGRPSLDPENKPSVRLAFRVPQDVSERVDALAAAQGSKRSEILRDALEAYLAAS